jgi:hypothetical protein
MRNDAEDGRSHTEIETLDWRPICQCQNASIVPPTILDPFGGTATTAIAAVRNGRNAVCIDASPAYLNQAVQRIMKQVYAPQFAPASPKAKRNKEVEAIEQI